MLTPDTIREVKSRGGVQAIAVSHPHFYTGVAAWAEAFDAPVFIHAKDRQWVTEPCSRITFWEGGCHLPSHQAHHTKRACMLALRIGPAFPGTTVPYWPEKCTTSDCPTSLHPGKSSNTGCECWRTQDWTGCRPMQGRSARAEVLSCVLYAQEMRRSCLEAPGCSGWAGTFRAARCCTGALVLAARAFSVQVSHTPSTDMTGYCIEQASPWTIPGRRETCACDAHRDIPVYLYINILPGP